jgi:hypothetical protein
MARIEFAKRKLTTYGSLIPFGLPDEKRKNMTNNESQVWGWLVFSKLKHVDFLVLEPIAMYVMARMALQQGRLHLLSIMVFMKASRLAFKSSLLKSSFPIETCTLPTLSTLYGAPVLTSAII